MKGRDAKLTMGVISKYGEGAWARSGIDLLIRWEVSEVLRVPLARDIFWSKIHAELVHIQSRAIITTIIPTAPKIVARS